MISPVTYRAARTLDGDTERHRWWITVADGIIVEASPEPPRGARAVDLGAVDLVAGMVDLHSDCWEDRAHPRPSSEIPLAEALVDLDTEVVSHGVTTHFVCVALEDDAGKRRSVKRATEAIGELGRARDSLRADHRVHLRVEVTGGRTDTARELVASEPAGLISYMDHTPGQGQYPHEADWRNLYLREGQSGQEADALLARRRAGRTRADIVRAELASVASEVGWVLASHDDDSEESVGRALRLGAAIAEFPVNEVAAKTARDGGLAIVMGAPNLRRGRSHLTNLSARQALDAGWLDVLTSDYHPASLLAASYGLIDDRSCSLGEAMALVSSNPARVAGLGDRGTIALGLRADLMAVGRIGGHPVIRQVWVAGSPVLGALGAQWLVS